MMRVLVAFVALPGLVAYVFPLLLAPPRAFLGWWQWTGPLLVAAGTTFLVWCVREFHLRGQGTLAPWSPPVHLVVTGPYQISRNPMYVAVVVILLGWSLWFGSLDLLWYALAVAIAFHLRIVLAEEPRLARSFGDAWSGYRDRVPRWIGRRRR